MAKYSKLLSNIFIMRKGIETNKIKKVKKELCM